VNNSTAIRIKNTAEYSLNPKLCSFCSTRIPYSKRKNKYCNSKCSENNTKINDLSLAQTDGTRKKILLGLRGPTCEICSLKEWCGKPIPLELDHISGDSDDNSSGNLRIICLNCHGQTPTYRALNRGKNTTRQKRRKNMYIRKTNDKEQFPKPLLVCLCGNTKSKKSKECLKCSHLRKVLANEKIQWPNNESLVQLVNDTSFWQAGKHLGVSDVAVKNRLKRFNLLHLIVKMKKNGTE